MNENNTVVLYQDEDGITRVDVRFSGEDVWLTREQIAQLYSTTPQNLSLHIGNIYADQELEEIPTRKKFFLVRQEGTRSVKREIDHYNLDMIIALGYRVQSQVATRFRRWATRMLHEYIQKGFAAKIMKYSQSRKRNCIAIVCCVMFSACAYLPSFSKGKALNMAEGNIEKNGEVSPDFYFQDSVFISNPVVVLTKSWHKYIMSQYFYESFEGSEKDLILSDSVFVFGYGYPPCYALQMEPFASKSQIDFGESLPPKSIFQKVRSIHNGCGWYYVFCFKEEVYYKNFVVIDSKEQLVKIPAEKKGYVQIAFPK